MLNTFVMFLFIFGALTVLHPKGIVPEENRLIWDMSVILGEMFGGPGRYSRLGGCQVWHAVFSLQGIDSRRRHPDSAWVQLRQNVFREGEYQSRVRLQPRQEGLYSLRVGSCGIDVTHPNGSLVLGQEGGQGKTLWVVHNPDVGTNSLMLELPFYLPDMAYVGGNLFWGKLTRCSLEEVVESLGGLEKGLAAGDDQPAGVEAYVDH